MTVKLFIFVNFFVLGEGKINPLLHCLGKEEEMIHQAKESGPVYRLNQWIISDIVAMNVHVKRDYLETVCFHKSFSPSVSFLRLFLMEGRKIFIRTKETSMVLDQLVGKLPDLFTGYLMELQALTPQAECLQKQSPHIAYYLNRFKYLQSDISAENLLNDSVRIGRIFKSLEKFDQMVTSCRSPKPSLFQGRPRRDNVKTK